MVLASMCGIALQMPKTLPLNNGRCCGGLPTADGRVVAAGLLLRSATPADASHEQCEHLRTQLSLRTVIDLRTPEEAGRDSGPRLLYHPDGPGAAPTVHYVPIVVPHSGLPPPHSGVPPPHRCATSPARCSTSS